MIDNNPSQTDLERIVQLNLQLQNENTLLKQEV